MRSHSISSRRFELADLHDCHSGLCCFEDAVSAVERMQCAGIGPRRNNFIALCDQPRCISSERE